MKKQFFLVAVAALTGCVTLQELRNGHPDLQFKSEKSVQVVSNCIMNNWQENVFRFGNILVQDYMYSEGGKTVYSETQGEMADVFKRNGKTYINFYHQKGLFSDRVNMRIKGIQRCL